MSYDQWLLSGPGGPNDTEKNCTLDEAEVMLCVRDWLRRKLPLLPDCCRDQAAELVGVLDDEIEYAEISKVL